jgi:endonuclease/exonuclease/phosphatase family metal-dependent hydrolase
MGDLNLPKNLPIAFSSWKSLVTANTYPSWGAKIQFDYFLANDLPQVGYQGVPISSTGISDHLPLSVEIFD